MGLLLSHLFVFILAFPGQVVMTCCYLYQFLEGIGVGGIMVCYVTHLQGRVFTLRTFTVITGPECTYWNAFLDRKSVV